MSSATVSKEGKPSKDMEYATHQAEMGNGQRKPNEVNAEVSTWGWAPAAAAEAEEAQESYV